MALLFLLEPRDLCAIPGAVRLLVLHAISHDDARRVAASVAGPEGPDVWQVRENSWCTMLGTARTTMVLNRIILRITHPSEDPPMTDTKTGTEKELVVQEYLSGGRRDDRHHGPMRVRVDAALVATEETQVTSPAVRLSTVYDTEAGDLCGAQLIVHGTEHLLSPDDWHALALQVQYLRAQEERRLAGYVANHEASKGGATDAPDRS